jgi:uncharacterized membrane protein (DUF485 family)
MGAGKLAHPAATSMATPAAVTLTAISTAVFTRAVTWAIARALGKFVLVIVMRLVETMWRAHAAVDACEWALLQSGSSRDRFRTPGGCIDFVRH